MIEFLQYWARVRIGLNRVGIKRVFERTGLFTSLVWVFCCFLFFFSIFLFLLCMRFSLLAPFWYYSVVDISIFGDCSDFGTATSPSPPHPTPIVCCYQAMFWVRLKDILNAMPLFTSLALWGLERVERSHDDHALALAHALCFGAYTALYGPFLDFCSTYRGSGQLWSFWDHLWTNFSFQFWHCLFHFSLLLESSFRVFVFLCNGSL
jgi:hypothetical protein